MAVASAAGLVADNVADSVAYSAADKGAGTSSSRAGWRFRAVARLRLVHSLCAACRRGERPVLGA